jgi:hypothetical protein
LKLSRAIDFHMVILDGVAQESLSQSLSAIFMIHSAVLLFGGA